MKASALWGALVAFLVMLGGLLLMGPCGPSSPIVYILIFPGLFLGEWFHNDWVVVLTQLVVGALIGHLVGRTFRRDAS